MSGPMNASPAAAIRVVPDHRECPQCGLVQAMPESRPGQTIRCARCHAWLRNRRADPVLGALACALTSAILYLVALTTPMMTLDVVGRTNTVSLLSGPIALTGSGTWLALVGLLVGFATILMPGLVIAGDIVLFTGALRRPMPRFVPRLLRFRLRFRQWAMIEVYMLGIFVAYTRLVSLAHVEVEPAIYALGAMMLMMIATDGAFDPEMVWEQAGARALQRQPECRGAVARPGHRLCGCHDCGLVLEAPAERLRCPRCGSDVHVRKPNSLPRTAAWLVAAVILYVPANVLPVLTLYRLGRGGPSTILGGVEELYAAGELPLALLVFFASITVPSVKILGLATMIVGTRLHSARGLLDRTRLFRVIDFIGRWSMIDVFMISILVAVVRFGFLASVRAEHGIVAFAGVVVLTIFAAEAFDPRLMWDAAAERRRA